MEYSFTLSDLPVGAGAGVGAFIRTLYLTASERYAIIGLQVRNSTSLLNLFERLMPDSTSLVSDLIVMLTGYDYVIPDKLNLQTSTPVIDSTVEGIGQITVESYILDGRDVYGITVPIKNGTTILSTDLFKDFYWTATRREIRLAGPTDGLCITFFVSEIHGSLRESESQAIFEASHNTNFSSVIFIPASGKRNSNCWSTLQTDSQSETVTIHLAGELSLDDDLLALRTVIEKYGSMAITCVNEQPLILTDE